MAKKKGTKKSGFGRKYRGGRGYGQRTEPKNTQTAKKVRIYYKQGKAKPLSAICRCGEYIESSVIDRRGQKEFEQHVMGINCPACRRFHIFSTDNGHSMTDLFNTDLETFYQKMHESLKKVTENGA